MLAKKAAGRDWARRNHLIRRLPACEGRERCRVGDESRIPLDPG